MTNTPESDTMKTLTELAKENGANRDKYAAHEITDESIIFDNEAQLLATFNAWSAQQKSHTNVLANELRNIAEAKRFKKEFFEDDKAFADWAQNRARHTLAAYEANQPII